MSTLTQEEIVIKKRNGGTNGDTASKLEAEGLVSDLGTNRLVKVTPEEVKALVEAKLLAILERAGQNASPEIAEPLGEWDLVALGPIQPGAGLFPGPQPYLPHQIIRVGEVAFIVTILYAPKLYHFCLPYEVEYCTGDLCEWKKGPTYLNVKHHGHFSSQTPFAIDVLGFRAQDAGCIFEMNICARILCADPHTAAQPPFAGFARRIFDLDPELPFPFFPDTNSFIPAHWQFDQPIRFMIYE
ncbi:MAG TPA: hypothetical protein VGA99_15560 [bacterium]